MKIRLEDIPPEGREVSFSFSSPDPKILGEQVLGMAEPLAVSVRLEAKGDMILARGEYRAKPLLSCSRCLKEFPYEVSEKLELVFQPAPGEMPEEAGLEDSELDVLFYEDQEIDLGRAVLSELSLAIPMAPVCSPDCRGLCPECGKPLADGGCSCVKETADPRWEKLKQFKPKQ